MSESIKSKKGVPSKVYGLKVKGQSHILPFGNLQMLEGWRSMIGVTNKSEILEYVLAGSERKRVLGELGRWAKGMEKYMHRITTAKNFVYDEDGHWDAGRERVYAEILLKIKEMEGK